MSRKNKKMDKEEIRALFRKGNVDERMKKMKGWSDEEYEAYLERVARANSDKKMDKEEIRALFRKGNVDEKMKKMKGWSDEEYEEFLDRAALASDQPLIPAA